MRNLAQCIRFLFVFHCLALAATLSSAQCTFFNEFKDLGDGTVLDSRSGLVWQRCAYGQTWSGSECRGEGVEVKWLDAASLALGDRTAGRSDWRLPTREEFDSVVGKYQSCKDNDWIREKFAASPMIASRVKAKYPGFFWSFSKANTPGTEMFVTNFIHGLVQPTAVDGFGCCNVKLVRGGSETSTSESVSAFQSAVRDEQQRLVRIEQDQRAAAVYAEQRKEAESAKRRRTQQNASLSERYLVELRCEEGKRLAETGDMDERPSFRYNECISEKKFRATESSRDPQGQYLAAVRYESDGERSRAKTLYLTIMERHPKHAIAVQAAGRLAALTDVQSIERSNASAVRAAREANDQSSRQSESLRRSVESANSAAADRAVNACRIEMDTCYSRKGSNCYRNCDALR